jgi:Flp pilus assembly protein TadB
MSKILFWIVVVVVVLLALRLLNVAKAKRRRESSAADSQHKPAVETMVRCVRCGVYQPRADETPGPHGPTCGDPRCALPR